MMAHNGCVSTPAMDLTTDDERTAVDSRVVAVNGHVSPQPDHNGAVNRVFSNSEIDVLRIIAQYMQNLGLNNTVKVLGMESGCDLEHPTAAKFRTHVLNGDWDQADDILNELQTLVETPAHITKMRFLLLEQKYLEYLDDGMSIEALTCLRAQISALKHNTKRVHKLTSYLMFTNRDELRRSAKWPGKGHLSRSKLLDNLQAYLPHSVMIPPSRLMVLLTQAVENQMLKCRYHNTTITASDSLSNVNFLMDHSCSSEEFPSVTTQVISQHNDEVWFCRFSPDGTKLATGSKDGVFMVWDVDMNTRQVRHRKSFEGHVRGVSYVAWSPNSVYAIVCGPDESPEIVIWNTQTFELKQRMTVNVEDSLSVAAWHADNKRYVIGGTKGQFYQLSIDNGEPEKWEGVRIQCLAILPDKMILAADTHHRIRGYNFDEQTDCYVIQEDHPIMSFTVNASGRLALLNVATQGVHMWDIVDRCLVRKFQGITQGVYMIHSCFGGVNQDFVASGSEDNKVYIWHISNEHPILTLDGHTRTVNCVDWNPKLADMLVSASDDTTLRIWAPAVTRSPDDASDSLASAARNSIRLPSRDEILMGADETTPV